MNDTNPYIESISVNLFDGLFSGEIKFNNGLNILSGENGTGKTRLINLLKSDSNRKFFNNRETTRIVVFNPLRNAEKRTLEQIVQRLKSQDLSVKKINDILRNIVINDSQLSTYNSFGEVFVLAYDDLNLSGGITIEDSVNQTQNNFNEILKQVFPQYEIVAEWKDKQLDLRIKKQGDIKIKIDELSRGESEVFALLFNIYANKEQEDIFLIDEPELHLNWDIERGLFHFLDLFCKNYKKQIIVASHSRVIFENEFLPKTKFLVWENGHIAIKDKPTEEIRQKIAGDALQLITAFDINKTVFYVEDERQKKVLEFLNDYYSKDYSVFVVNGRPNVQNLCRYLTSEGYKNAYFLVDGDNQGKPKGLENKKQYIQLRKYCIENYFLNSEILTKIANKTEEEVKTAIKEGIKNSPVDQHTLVYKKLVEVSDIPDEVLDTYNAKKIIENVYYLLGLNNSSSFIDLFLEKCKEKNRIEEIFGEITEVIKEI